MTLHLRAASTSVVLDLPADRFPVVRHWGADLGDLPADALEDAGTAGAASVGTNTAWITNDLPVLPLPHLGWSARPAVGLHRADGTVVGAHVDRVTHEVTHLDDGATEVVSTGTGAVDALRLTTCIRLEATGLLRLRASVTDTRSGDDLAPLLVDEVTPVLPVPADSDELLDMTGHHGHERNLVRTPFTPGTRLRESWEGRPGHDATTWVIAGRSGFGWRSGTVHGVHVAWSGNTRSLAENLPHGRRLLGGGELLAPGEVVLGEGQTYTSPWLVASWGQGLDDLASRVHQWLRSRPTHPRRPRPVLLNTWEAVYFDHDLDTLTRLADEAAGLGIERYVLDDGWFGSRRDDTSGLGDWEVSAQVWPTGLEPLAQHVRDLGMEFGLWFEPEMVNVDSDTARAHPEWLLDDGAGGAPEHRNQRVLDLCAPGAWDHLLERLSDLVGRLQIAYIKWDHNSPVYAAGHQVAGGPGHPARPGAPAVHDQTLALYALLDALRERFPALEIESCAGGGGRVDLGIIERTERVWTSDCIDAHDRHDIYRGTTLLLPPELVGTHVGSGRDHTTLRSLDMGFRAGTALWGHMGVEWDLLSATAQDKATLASLISLHRDLRPLLHTGRVVHADLHDDDTLRIQGVVAQDGSDALFEVALLGQTLAWPGSPRPLPGLDHHRTYHVRLATPPYAELAHQAGWMGSDGVRLPGSYLTQVGLALPTLHPDHLVLVRATAVD